MKDRILTVKEVSKISGVSIPTLYRWERKGKAPVKKQRLGPIGGPSRVGYKKSDVEEWLGIEIE